MSSAEPLAEKNSFHWSRWPETEEFLNSKIELGLNQNAFARRLADRMPAESGTLFKDWVDLLVLGGSPEVLDELIRLGYVEAKDVDLSSKNAIFEHHGGLFPRVQLVDLDSGEVPEIAIKVESVVDFSQRHDLGLKIEGKPYSRFRRARIPGSGTTLAIHERRGRFISEPDESAGITEHVLTAREIWQNRPRNTETDAQGFDLADAALEATIEAVDGDTSLACHVVFEVERAYWQSRNRAARVQKERQDRLGLGWANHDHHTFRSSRRVFPRLIRIFERLGFQLREHFHAGQHAGWGEVLEHPTAGIVIFADLDLAPDELEQDFSHQVLPDLSRPNTVGLWVGLHGESMLGAGMHHLEAQFSFDDLRDGLLAEANIETMKPFSNFSFLRQAFTAGERWAVAPSRADRLLREGWIDAEQHERFLREGTIGSHLENLQRREGYKGFNQQAVSAIIAETDPRLH